MNMNSWHPAAGSTIILGACYFKNNKTMDSPLCSQMSHTVSNCTFYLACKNTSWQGKWVCNVTHLLLLVPSRFQNKRWMKRLHAPLIGKAWAETAILPMCWVCSSTSRFLFHLHTVGLSFFPSVSPENQHCAFTMTEHLSGPNIIFCGSILWKICSLYCTLFYWKVETVHSKLWGYH